MSKVLFLFYGTRGVREVQAFARNIIYQSKMARNQKQFENLYRSGWTEKFIKFVYYTKQIEH